MSRQSFFRMAGAGSVPLAAAILLGGSLGPAPSKIAGTIQAKYAEQHPLLVPDAAGHALMVARAEGTNRSTGPTPYLDKGQVSNFEFGDLTKGNGGQQGYIAITLGADSVISKWSGKVTTTLSPNQTPITTFQGAWATVRGTGRYAGSTGKGRYQGHFTSQTEYTIEWSGELSGEHLAER